MRLIVLLLAFLPQLGVAQSVTLAITGGRILSPNTGPPTETGAMLSAGKRITAAGPARAIPVPSGIRVIDANGMTVMPGLIDMHVHLQILGHGDYKRWNDLYGTRNAELVMPIAARQLLGAGVTSARDLGAPLEDIIAVKRKIERNEIPGPRLFVSGPFIQHAPYEEYEKPFRWGVSGADDAKSKVQRLITAGVDVIKLIDQDQMTDGEVAAVVQTAHAAGKAVVAHARSEERTSELQ